MEEGREGGQQQAIRVSDRSSSNQPLRDRESPPGGWYGATALAR
jgi:hypothetical protein